jgi:hypothetical protein
VHLTAYRIERGPPDIADVACGIATQLVGCRQLGGTPSSACDELT